MAHAVAWPPFARCVAGCRERRRHLVPRGRDASLVDGVGPQAAMLRIAVVVASVFLISQAHADYRRFCVPQGQCFVCPRGQPACEMSYALSRAMTPATAPSIDAWFRLHRCRLPVLSTRRRLHRRLRRPGRSRRSSGSRPSSTRPSTSATRIRGIRSVTSRTSRRRSYNDRIQHFLGFRARS